MNDEQLDVLACQLFKIFAEYEYALKQDGYFKNTNRGDIIIDWNKFANEKIGNDFLESLGENSESAKYILDKPPMKQTVINSNIIWKEISNNGASVQVLFEHIRRVRNNLFHGAKFGTSWFEPSRSKKLIHHSIIVLNSFKSKLYN